MTLGLPASSRSGIPVHSTSSTVTKSTAPPPASSGSASPTSSVRTTSTPAPNGAYILCPLKARQSMSIAAMSMARCGASCAASTLMIAPCACASRAIAATGMTSPVTLLAPVTATTAMRPPPARSAASIDSSSAAGDGGGGRCSHRPEPTPRQHVGVVLHLGGQHRGAVGNAQARGQVVDRVRGVADEHDRIAVAGADEGAPPTAAPPRRAAWTPGRGGRRRDGRCCTRAARRVTALTTGSSAGVLAAQSRLTYRRIEPSASGTSMSAPHRRGRASVIMTHTLRRPGLWRAITRPGRAARHLPPPVPP